MTTLFTPSTVALMEDGTVKWDSQIHRLEELEKQLQLEGFALHGDFDHHDIFKKFLVAHGGQIIQGFASEGALHVHVESYPEAEMQIIDRETLELRSFARYTEV